MAEKRKTAKAKSRSSQTSQVPEGGATPKVAKKARGAKSAKTLRPPRSPASKNAKMPSSSLARVVQAELIEPRADLDDRVDDSEAYLIPEPSILSSGGHSDAEDATEDVEPIQTDLEGSEAPKVRTRRLPVPIADATPSVASDDPITTYLAEIRKYPLLTKEQEHDLAVRFREKGDASAAEKLVTSNLRFVVKIATEYSKFGAKLIDLIQEGNVGLMHAVREFNPYKGVRLITYAVWWIRGYIQEYLMRQYSMVRIGTTQNQRKLFYRLQKEKAKLDSMGQEATVPLLSSRLGVTEDEVRMMSQRLSGRDISLNQPLDTDSSSSLLDFETSEEPSIDERLGTAEQLEVLRENLEKIRPSLSEKELYVLDHRILADDPLTLQEIGEHYGVTREAVRQLEARLINRIRSAFEESTETPVIETTARRQPTPSDDDL